MREARIAGSEDQILREGTVEESDRRLPLLRHADAPRPRHLRYGQQYWTRELGNINIDEIFQDEKKTNLGQRPSLSVCQRHHGRVIAEDGRQGIRPPQAPRTPSHPPRRERTRRVPYGVLQMDWTGRDPALREGRRTEARQRHL